jgi:hypothetical protein
MLLLPMIMIVIIIITIIITIIIIMSVMTILMVPYAEVYFLSSTGWPSLHS